MKRHSLHPDQVMSQTQIPAHPAGQEAAHPQGEGEEGGGEEEEEGEEEKEEGEEEGEGEGGEEAVHQEAEVVNREVGKMNHINFYKSMQWVIKFVTSHADLALSHVVTFLQARRAVCNGRWQIQPQMYHQHCHHSPRHTVHRQLLVLRPRQSTSFLSSLMTVSLICW